MEDKYLKEMQEVFEKYKDDNEELHAECDYILVKFLRKLGYKKIADLYGKIADGFWYA